MKESDEKWWELLIELYMYNLLINIEFFIKNSENLLIHPIFSPHYIEYLIDRVCSFNYFPY